MKTLLLMRHAKSSWKKLDIEDRERPLNKKGEKDAPKMGRLLADKELLPEIVLSSTAVRSRMSAEAVLSASKSPVKATYIDAFYMAEPATYLNAIRALSNEVERAMVIGHNPGLEGLLQMLVGQIISLPTASIAYISIPIKRWDELELDGNISGELIELWRPRDFKEKEKPKEKEKVEKAEKEKEKGKSKAKEEKEKKGKKK